MLDPEYNWRLLSESFDRELSDDELNLLEHFMAEQESPREFEEFFKRIWDNSIQSDSIPEIVTSVNQRLSDEKQMQIQRLLESAMKQQRDWLSNRDVVFACELVSQGAIGLGELTEEISKWNSESKSLSRFLKTQSSFSDADFSKIESHVSDTIFSQTLDQTLLDEVITAIKRQAPDDDCTVLEDSSDDFVSSDFIQLLDKANSGESGAFELLLDRLTNESRSVIFQARKFSDILRPKPVVDEVTLRLAGRKKLDQAQLVCYYRNVAIAIRILFESDPELSDCWLRSIGNWNISVKQVVDSLRHLEDEESGFVQMFNLRFFAGLSARQVSSLLKITEHEVSVECGYGMARLMQLIDE